MKLFNTLTQSLQDFTPIDDTVRIYVCGVTPYDTTHLGHAFTYVSFDTLIRYLEYRGHKVRYIQNVTDIDDDIIRKSRELGLTWNELGNREIERFLNDLKALDVRMPDVYARATDEISRIIEFVETLIKRGYAYVSEGCVFYDVRKDSSFGELGRAVGLQDYESMLAIANERGNFPEDTRKKDPLDFVLWQAQAPDEPAWESPWGPGRPGWHIECSSMSMHYLGEQIDIHGGGADLTFPHHTCEIAQSEHYTEKAPFVRNWMHTGMVYQDGEKMSKSLGNLTLISNLLKEHSADAIRVLLQSHHYRYPWECFPEDLKIADETVLRLQQVRQLVGEELQGGDTLLHNRFIAAMDSDLNSPEAVMLLRQASQEAVDTQNSELGSEVLRLAQVLGLHV
ncbi:MAG TPA: cysteine--tRNA ligase [Dictyobacter sp.]|jgi:L-cysteine:1D-myo-inositol 2-amino-2-deoxy-alpha-D-glucopyranoside ligase|nr:cysteine--tRNA ligase [Dictyobacter sp.]